MSQGATELSPVPVAMEQHPLNFSPTIFGIIRRFGPITVIRCFLAKSSSKFSQLKKVVIVTDHFPPYRGGGRSPFLRSEISLHAFYLQS